MRKEIEVMRVLRVPPLGKLVVEFKDKRYEKLSDIEEDNVKQMMMAAVGELIDFVGGYEVLADAGMAPNLKPLKSTIAAEPETLEEQQALFLASMEAEKEALKEAKPRKKGLAALNISSSSLETPPAAVIEKKPTSMAEQIDAILQKHLAADPDLAQRDIELLQSSSGGLRIKIDGHYYDRPREIEDKKIKLLLKMAFREWENR